MVCAGANRANTPERGILTADAVSLLDLRGLELAVLSACDTGLGDVAGGEGVYGLTRAFHVAGPRDVVASLWKVEDDATAALMTLFYRNLWRDKLTPVEALRQAQLALYRHPDHIAEWAKAPPDRGPSTVVPPREGSALPGTVKPARTARTKQWAAFVLSGAGR